MKNSMVWSVAASLIVTSLAMAAPSKSAAKIGALAPATAEKAAARKKGKAKKAAPKSAAASEVAPQVPVTTPEAVTVVPPTPETPVVVVSPAASAGQTTAAAPVAPVAPQKSKFGVLLVDRLDMNMAKTNTSTETEAEGALTVRPSYRLSDASSLALGVDIDHSYGTTANEFGNKTKWSPNDMYLMFAHSNLGEVVGGIQSKGYLRLYAPTSEASQDKGQIAMLRGSLTLSKPLGSFTVSYTAEPRAYFQRNNTFENPTKSNAVEATTAYRFEHYLRGEYKASDMFNLYSELGVNHYWMNGDSAVNVPSIEKELAHAESGVEVALNSNLTLIGGVEQNGAPDLLRQAPGKEGPVYREEFTNYFVEADVSF